MRVWVRTKGLGVPGPAWPDTCIAIRGENLHAPLVERILEIPMDISGGGWQVRLSMSLDFSGKIRKGIKRKRCMKFQSGGRFRAGLYPTLVSATVLSTSLAFCRFSSWNGQFSHLPFLFNGIIAICCHPTAVMCIPMCDRGNF